MIFFRYLKARKFEYGDILFIIRYLVRFFRYLFISLFNFQLPSVSFIGSNSKIRCMRKFKHNGMLNIGDNVIIDCNSKNGVEVGYRFTIRDYSKIDCQGLFGEVSNGMIVGDNVGLSEYCFIQVRGKVEIGNDVIMGPRVSIFSETHLHSDSDKAIRLQGTKSMDVTIGSNVWIGSNVTILGGVNIGSGTIIGAGSLVNTDLLPNSVYAGVPAKLIKKRF